jgi:MFS family permease
MVLAVVSIALFMVNVDATIVNVALPDIQHDLHLSQSSLTWIINAYTLTFAGFLLFGGCRSPGQALGVPAWYCTVQCDVPVGRAVGERRGIDQRPGRAGLGSGGAHPCDIDHPHDDLHRAKGPDEALGIWASAAGAGAAAGVLAGGILTDLLSWRWILFINVPIGVLLLIVAPLCIKESRGLASRSSRSGHGHGRPGRLGLRHRVNI